MNFDKTILPGSIFIAAEALRMGLVKPRGAARRVGGPSRDSMRYGSLRNAAADNNAPPKGDCRELLRPAEMRDLGKLDKMLRSASTARIPGRRLRVQRKASTGLQGQ